MASTEFYLTPPDMFFRESLVCHRQQYNGVYIPQIHSLHQKWMLDRLIRSVCAVL